MLFDRIAHQRYGSGICLKQTLLIMKFSVVFMLVACMQVSARGVGQVISLSEKNVSLTQVFRQIQRQAPYDFVYSVELLRDAGRVNVAVRNATIQDVMRACLKDKPLTYEVIGKTIVVKGRTPEQQTGQMIVMAALPPEAIKGVVVDEKGKPIAGATVLPRLPKGMYSSTGITHRATSTNDKGEFALYNMNGPLVLEVSCIGYKTVEVRMSLQPMRIVLVAEEAELKEMVIVGYSTKKVTELTGATQTISGDDLRQGVSGANTLAMLKGKTAGLYIVESASNNAGSVANRGQVVMRGQASMPDASNTNFGPLIVLDGVITMSDNLQDIVNPNDIESITLLKDAASTSIYGSRAAQGVILITTKRGQAGKLAVNFSLNYGKVQNNRLVDYMTTSQLTTHIEKYMDMLYNANNASGLALRNRYGSYANYFNTTRIFAEADRNVNYDWSGSAFFPDGKQNDMNLSMMSGNDKTKFYAAINWLKQDGTLLDDRLDRKSIRLNIDQKISDKLTASFNTNVIADQYTASTGENQSYILQPWVTPYEADGRMADSIPQYAYVATGAKTRYWYSNPLYRHELNTAVTSRQSYLGTGILKYAVAPWLTLQTTNTIQRIYNNVNNYRDPRTFRGKYNGPSSAPVYMNGEIQLNDTRTTYYLTSNLISFKKRFGEHQLSALAGQEYGKTRTEFTSVSAYNTPYPGERNLGAFLNNGIGSSTWIYVRSGLPITAPSSAATTEKASYSLFTEINDNYKGKYLASVAVRRDASTNFGRLRRYGTFYSASGAWQIDKEQFMKTVKPITNLKLRASYGTSGREAGADFLNFTIFQESAANAYDVTTNTGASIQRLANNEITWETTYTTDIGIDISLWSRINLTVDFYNRQSKGLIQNVTLPTYQGSLTQIRNVGELRNRGVDILLSTTNIQHKNFSWTTDFNISFNANKLVRIYGDSLRDGFTGSYYRYTGEDINTLKAITFRGVNPDNGRPLFESVMPDKSVVLVDSIPLARNAGFNSFQTQGSATPKFFGGITNTFRYKGMSLSVLFNFVYGNKIFNNSLRNFISPSVWTAGYNMMQPNDAVRFWKGPGDTEANYSNYFDPAFAERGITNINSSRLVQDASYIRLRNIRLAYELPASVVKKMKMSNVSLYLSADNVFVIKSKDLFSADPEGATVGNSASNIYGGTGIWSAMPRRFLAGISIGF